jgi:Bacterial PH domain
MSAHHDDFAFEPIPGLPARPPAGEDILWQGRPDTLALAREAMGLTWVAAWFGLLALWHGGTALMQGAPLAALVVALPYLGLGAVACGVILAIAWVQARATVYTITTARVAMRIGAALNITLNLPHREIEAASLDLRRSGTGTIALKTPAHTRLSYLVCWPHVRPWRMGHTEPALRCIPDAAEVARLLADAAEARQSVPVLSRKPAIVPVPAQTRAPDLALATG